MVDGVKEEIKQAQKGDKTAKERLIKENAGLIWSIVKRYGNRGYELEDLYQIGAIGLLKCIEKFNEGYGVEFSTYAVPMIMGEIKRFLRDDGLIKVSRPIKEISVKAKYAEENFLKRTGKVPSINDLAEELKVPIEDLILAMESNKVIESIYKTVEQSDGSVSYLLDRIRFDEETDTKIIDKIALRDIIDKLGDFEKEIIVQRYFLDKTQTEVAKKLNISQVQVSRLEKKILTKMRENFGAENKR